MKGNLDETGAAWLKVRVDSGAGEAKEVRALIDTGATQSMIPQEMAGELELAQRGKARVSSAHREGLAPVYYAFLTMPGLYERTASFVEMKPPYDFIVIGREILRKMRLNYDGPGGTFEIVAEEVIRSD